MHKYKNKRKEDYGTYNVNSNKDRADLINKLNDASKWSSLLNGNVNLSSKGCIAKGTVDLDTWVASWNENNGYTRLYTATNSTGYYVGTSENPTTKSEDLNGDAVGYGNKLYFPHKEIVDGCDGYWLASPSAFGKQYVIGVYYPGYVNFNHCHGNGYGARPVISLTSNVLTSGKNASGAWVIE